MLSAIAAVSHGQSAAMTLDHFPRVDTDWRAIFGAQLTRAPRAVHSAALLALMQVPGLATTYRITKEGQGGKPITPGTTATLHATGIIKETGEGCHMRSQRRASLVCPCRLLRRVDAFAQRARTRHCLRKPNLLQASDEK